MEKMKEQAIGVIDQLLLEGVLTMPTTVPSTMP